MKNLLKTFYHNYYLYSEKRTPVHNSDSDIVSKWRDEVFLQILMVLTPLSFIIYILSLIPSISEKLTIISVFDTITFLAVLFIYFSKKTTVNRKKKILLIILYLLGLILLIYLGPGGPAFSYLLAVSIFASLIISSKSGFITLLKFRTSLLNPCLQCIKTIAFFYICVCQYINVSNFIMPRNLAFLDY